MKVLLYGKVIKESDTPFIEGFLNLLQNKDFEVSIYNNFRMLLNNQKVNTKNTVVLDDNYLLKNSDLDLVFSIGGDGTMLSSSLLVGNSGIPILGINLGRLGFLASIDKKHCASAIDLIAKRKYSIEQRSMLKLITDNNLFGENPVALNDFTIQKRTSSSMITIHSYVNNEYFNSYWCNGIIVATPTGSTAFSMSCGGPIVLPFAKNLILTPLAPHNLNIRPVILPDNIELSFEIESRSDELYCTLDSRFNIISPDQKLTIKTNQDKMNLVKLDGYNYFNTLRNKLMWGKDVRNL